MYQKYSLKGEYKIANLSSYWYNDFIKNNKEELSKGKLKVFKRGTIVKANLGFNIGNELRGIHFCIVIEKFDNPKNGTLTVVPLTSKKSNKIYNQSTLNLGNEIYNIILKNKIKIDKINIKKKDSIALVNQITTISKQRILNEELLKKVRVSNEILDLLDNKIIELLTHSIV